MKKRISILFMMLVLLSLMSFESLAATDIKGEKSGSMPITIGVNQVDSSQIPQPKYPGLAGVYEVKVFAADSTIGKYYTEYYTTMQGNGNQWCNGTVGPKTANIYRTNNCDSFYIMASVKTDGANYWEAYDGTTKIGNGYMGTGNTDSQFTLLVTNNNPGYWKILLWHAGETQTLPLWGNISLPEA